MENILPIESLDHYIERSGLRSEQDVGPKLDQIEAHIRVQDEQDYQQELLNKLFDTPPNEARLNLLASLADQEIRLDTLGGAVTARLLPLATQCDTVFTFVSARPLFQPDSVDGWQLSLGTFEYQAVTEFVQMVQDTLPVARVSSELVVECCQLAHYLQCPSILEAMTSILVVSVDSANCQSLFCLADRLNLPNLFESTMTYMMDSLNHVEEQAGDDLSPELKECMSLIKSAIQSSVVGNPRVYFGSLKEYLAIFAERVEYYQERLKSAKKGPVTPYSQRLIDKQEDKVKTLEAVMREQQLMFARKDATIRIHIPNRDAE
jgi:hypothetical protein